MNKDYYKLRVLLQLFEQEEIGINVTALSRMLELGKTYVSKMMHELEGEGLVDLTNNRRPCLTGEGMEKAAKYAGKVQITLNRLLSEGVAPRDAMNDACIIALYCSDATNSINRKPYMLRQIKELMQEKRDLNGDELCRQLEDGQYSVDFTLYKTRDRDRSQTVLSMANDGFEQPCILIVREGIGTFTLKSKTMVFHSKIAEADIAGKASLIRYQDGTKFFPCEHIGDIFTFPASAVRFRSLSSGSRQILHGFIRLSIQCDIGVMYMPQSTAICTFIL